MEKVYSSPEKKQKQHLRKWKRVCDMSIHVTDFKWEKGKNDLKYIELLEKTLKNEQAITSKAVAKIRELAKEKEELKERLGEQNERN